MKIFAAAIAAVAVQPLVLYARLIPAMLVPSGPWAGVGGVVVVVCAIAAAAVLVLGIPAFLLLRRLRRDSWASLAFTGFVLGTLASAVSWPRHLEGYSGRSIWHGRNVQAYVDGNPTNYAWLTFAENLVFFGLHGLVGALVFYGVWRRLSRFERQFPMNS